MKKAIQVQVSLVFLENLLHLPDGAKITHIGQLSLGDRFNDTFNLVIEHPDLPEVIEGEEPAEALPEWELDENGRAVFKDWGIG